MSDAISPIGVYGLNQAMGANTAGSPSAAASGGASWLSGIGSLMNEGLKSWVTVEAIRGGQAVQGADLQNRYYNPELTNGAGVMLDQNAYQLQQQRLAAAAGNGLQIAGLSVPALLIGAGIVYFLLNK